MKEQRFKDCVLIIKNIGNLLSLTKQNTELLISYNNSTPIEIIKSKIADNFILIKQIEEESRKLQKKERGLRIFIGYSDFISNWEFISDFVANFLESEIYPNDLKELFAESFEINKLTDGFLKKDFNFYIHKRPDNIEKFLKTIKEIEHEYRHFGY